MVHDRFGVGAVVRIGRYHTTVVGVYSDIAGGRRVNPEVEGFKSWNIDAMKLIRPAPSHSQQQTCVDDIDVEVDY